MKCAHGHELTSENTYESGGRWFCRECHRQRQAAYRIRKYVTPAPAKLREVVPPHIHDGISVVYFITDGVGHVKIGRAINVTQRLNTIQISSAFELTLLATMPGRHREERELHVRFAEYRVRGEWFKLVPEIQDFIKKLSGS